MTNTVNIILTTFCGEKYLTQQLDSLFAQTYDNFMITIRDDMSSDGTNTIIQEYASKHANRITVITDSYGNLGCRASFLMLLQNSDYDYVMFCDQDDFWLPRKVENTLAAMKRIESKFGSASPCLVFTDLIVTNENLSTLSNSFWAYQKLIPEIALNWKQLASQNVVTGCTIMLNKSVKFYLQKHIDLSLFHDHLVSIICAKYGHIEWLDEQSILYRQHQSNAVGAFKVDKFYVLKKLMHLKLMPLYRTLYAFKKISLSFDNEVSVFELICFKIYTNLKRLLN